HRLWIFAAKSVALPGSKSNPVTFGLVLVEAMRSGKPVVCSRIAGLPDIVEDGVTGLLFEPGNATDLAAKIHHLREALGHRRRMGEAGRQKALREYSPETYYKRLMAAYEKAMLLGPGGPQDRTWRCRTGESRRALMNNSE